MMLWRAALAGAALAAGVGAAQPTAVRAQELTCTAPSPALRPPAAHKYFMIIVDSSGSMNMPVVGAGDSCGYQTGGTSPYSDVGDYTRLDHARCAVTRIVSQFGASVDFGLAQFATRSSSTSSACYAGWTTSDYPSSLTALGCGPKPGDYTTRAGARILEPVNANADTVLRWVDNDCSAAQEVGKDGNTPLNGALRDMKRYLGDHWTAPDGAVSYSTPLAGNSCPGRSINVILLTDGDESCDTSPANAAALAARDLYDNGVTVGAVNYKVKTYVINFSGGDMWKTNAIALYGGTNMSYLANNEAQLLAAMREIMAAPSDGLNGVDDDCNACVDDGWSQLSLTASAAPALVGPGQTATYTFEASNAGPTDADARVQITNLAWGEALSLPPLPPLVGPAGWTCAAGACTNPAFAAGTTATFTVTPTIGAGAVEGATPAYTAEIKPIQFVQDPDTTDDAASAAVTIHVRTAPTITWPAPDDIVFGTALGGTQLNAAASVPGTFSYSPVAGSVLTSGAHTLLVDFTPDDTDDYSPVSTSVSITVLKATPGVSVTGGTFTYDGAQHAATASATGVGGAGLTPVTITYDGTAAVPVSAGTYAVVASYAGDDNYEPAAANATITIDKAAPLLTWSTPLAIVYGTPVGGAQLDASSTVAGTFVYTPAAGTVLGAGPGQTLLVAFTPADEANYTAASASVSIDVLKATPAIKVTGGTFTYDGAAHAATASATGMGGAPLTPVTITYDGTSAVPVEAGAYSVLASYAGDSNYQPASGAGSITINRAASILWGAPGAITYGTPLGSAQLDATANVAGVFTYTPPAGTVLAAGSGYPLSVAFAPTDGRNYQAGTASVAIDVVKATPVVTVTGGTFPYDGAPHAATASATGVGGVALLPVTITYDGSFTVPSNRGTYAVVASYAGNGNYTGASATTTLGILNNGPTCTAARATPSLIWPPNNGMTRVQIVGVTDPDADAVSVAIASIFQDEPNNTDGDPTHAPDGQGVGTPTAYVRAERAGNKAVPGNGRVYHIRFNAADGLGGTCMGEVTVGVPHDARGAAPLDDGPLYDSTIPALGPGR